MYRSLPYTSILLSSLLLSGAQAQLTVPLSGTSGARPVAANASKKPAPRRGQLPSRSLPQQIGVQRRGAPPVLPPVDGTAVLPRPEPAGQELPVSARLGRTLAPRTDVYRLPDPRSQWVGKLSQGQEVAVVSQWQGWFAIVMADGSQAYVPQTHLEMLPYQVTAVTRVQPEAAAPVLPPAGSTGGQYPLPNNPFARAVIQEAFTYMGVPYVYGGNTESGIDCSGLVKNCFAAHGARLPRRAIEQAEVGEPVPFDALQPGDRLYFSVKKTYDHTGIYLGNGYFIHAARSRGKVTVDHLSTPLYGNSLSAARR